MTEQPTCRQCSKPISFKQKASGDGWDRVNPDGSPHTHEQRRGGGGKSPQELRDIRRQVAAKVAGQLVAAAISSHEDARVDHFPRVADMVLGWIEKGGTATD